MEDRDILKRYARLFRKIAEEYPAFWVELAEVVQRRQDQWWTDIFKGWLRIVEVVTQARVPGSHRSVGTQTVAATRDAVTQTEPGSLSQGASEEEEPEHRAGPKRPNHLWPSQDQRTVGCWNSSREGHRANACPLPQLGVYCYRCGRQGTTIKECPECSDDWRAQGPYISGRGHPGGDPPRRGRRGDRPRGYQPY